MKAGNDVIGNQIETNKCPFNFPHRKYNVKYIFFISIALLKIMFLMIKRFHYYSLTIYLFNTKVFFFVYIYALVLHLKYVTMFPFVIFRKL